MKNWTKWVKEDKYNDENHEENEVDTNTWIMMIDRLVKCRHQ